MGVVVGLMLGAGVFCVWWSFWEPGPPRDRRPSRWSLRTQDLLLQAGIASLTPGRLLGGAIAGACTVLVLAAGVTGSLPIASCFAAMAALAPAAWVRSRARRRQRGLRDVWPEVVDHLVSAVRAGLSLPEALGQIGERGPVPLRPAFQAFARDYRATGRFVMCLDALKARLADPVADRLVEALRMTSEVGGTDLGLLLRTLSAFLREDARTRNELEARQSVIVNGARLAAAGPWVVLALLSTRPGTAQAYDSVAGLAVLGVGAVSSVAAYRIMRGIGRLPADVRVLR